METQKAHSLMSLLLCSCMICFIWLVMWWSGSESKFQAFEKDNIQLSESVIFFENYSLRVVFHFRMIFRGSGMQ